MAPACDSRAPDGSRRRLILLGASNVTLGFACVVRNAVELWGGPLDVLAAIGHGRSYGSPRTVWFRELPGILDCGLWDALRKQSATPTAAVVTDIGNDLLYDIPVPTIVAWVAECLDRLAALDAHTVMTALPLCGVERLSRRRFLMLRTLVFPGCRLGFDTVMERARELDRGVRELANRRHIALAEPQAEWYGFDPIHLRRQCRQRAWREILARAWPASADIARISIRSRIRQPKAERRREFGRARYTTQPGRILADGTTLSLY